METLLTSSGASLDHAKICDLKPRELATIFNKVIEEPASEIAAPEPSPHNMADGNSNFLQLMLQLMQSNKTPAAAPTDNMLMSFLLNQAAYETKAPQPNPDFGSNFLQILQKSTQFGATETSNKIASTVPSLANFVPTSSNLLMPQTGMNFLGLNAPLFPPLGVGPKLPNYESSYFPCKVDEELLPMDNKPVDTMLKQSAKIPLFSSSFNSFEINPSLKSLDKHEDMLRKFTSFEECGSSECRTSGVQEHFHCTQCERVS
ncbi:hypothetical protein Ciccas_002690 [Cichlidogyrus casuarinus]|uniref:Uncharacterized protein n=1 Tax=Cichlidogyrus casuarinus TaxID=1844966 RepID=A0ABD2QGR5_9PLAT